MTRTLKALLASLFLLLPLAACTVEKTEEGELPDVEVKVEGEAKLPEYDVDAPEVDVKMEEKTIKVPEVDVKTPQEEGYDDGESETDHDDGEGGNG